jgi:hypothetical protein
VLLETRTRKICGILRKLFQFVEDDLLFHMCRTAHGVLVSAAAVVGQIGVSQPYLLDARRIRFFRQLWNLGAKQSDLLRIRQGKIRQNPEYCRPAPEPVVLLKSTSIDHLRSPLTLHPLPHASRPQKARLRARWDTAPPRAPNDPATGTSPLAGHLVFAACPRQNHSASS